AAATAACARQAAQHPPRRHPRRRFVALAAVAAIVCWLAGVGAVSVARVPACGGRAEVVKEGTLPDFTSLSVVELADELFQPRRVGCCCCDCARRRRLPLLVVGVDV